MRVAHVELILLITGLATSGALIVCFAPVSIMKLLFGQAPSDSLGILIARHWGLLICLVGVLLICAAYHAEIRVPAMVVAVVEKSAFFLGVFISPWRRRPPALVAALADAGMAIMYGCCLLGL